MHYMRHVELDGIAFISSRFFASLSYFYRMIHFLRVDTLSVDVFLHLFQLSFTILPLFDNFCHTSSPIFFYVAYVNTLFQFYLLKLGCLTSPTLRNMKDRDAFSYSEK